MESKLDQSPLFFLTLRNGAWEVRVHKPPISPGWRHIHITAKRLKGEYSWNINGSRHDKHKFPINDKWIKRAKTLAAQHLNVPVDTLQFLTSAAISSRQIILEIFWENDLQVLVAGGKGASLAVLSSQDGSVHFMIVKKSSSRRSE